VTTENDDRHINRPRRIRILFTEIDFEPMRASSTDIDRFVSGKPAEVFPGVTERRYFLRCSLETVAAIVTLGATTKSLLAQELAGGAGAVAADKLAWDSFLKESVPLAQRMIADPAFSVDEYLYRVGSLATRLKEIPDTKLFPYKGVAPSVSFAPSFKGSPFFIIQWQMEPDAILPPHNHPNYSVCTLGYQGEARLRNFEIAGEALEYASKKTFRIRETHNEVLAPGRINALSPTRDNIHYFQAGKTGARGIDITTPHGKNVGFSFLDISDKPVDPEKRIFEAVWNDPAGQATSSKS